MNSVDWHTGCSGFHYKHWKGTFYPQNLPQRLWFGYYAEHFKTLELNVTFYRFPQLSVLQKWYHDAPADFRFSVKAPKAITHFKQFHGTADMLISFYDTIREGLKEKLGPVLFQFPPRFHYEEERLKRVTDQLDPGFDNVLEFRHRDWWQPDVFETLGKKHIAFCGMSHPDLPDDVIVNTDFAYYRFHGVPDLYRSGYNNDFLKNVANRMQDAAGLKQAWCYFNNDAAVAAIPNAQTLEKIANSL